MSQSLSNPETQTIERAVQVGRPTVLPEGTGLSSSSLGAVRAANETNSSATDHVSKVIDGGASGGFSISGGESEHQHKECGGGSFSNQIESNGTGAMTRPPRESERPNVPDADPRPNYGHDDSNKLQRGKDEADPTKPPKKDEP